MGHDAAEQGLVVARRPPRFRVVARLVALAGMLMALAPQAFARETVQQRIDALLVGSELYMPEGEGPFPVVLQFHGCGGMKNLQARWADTARAAGWAVLVVDSDGVTLIVAVTEGVTEAAAVGVEEGGRTQVPVGASK